MRHDTPRRLRLILPLLEMACLLASVAGAQRQDNSSMPIRLDGQDSSLFFYEGQPTLLAGYYPGLQALSVAPQVDTSNPLGSQYYKDMIDLLSANHINLIRVMLPPNMALQKKASLGMKEWLHPYQRVSKPSCNLAVPATCTVHAVQVGTPGNKFDLNSWNETFFQYRPLSRPTPGTSSTSPAPSRAPRRRSTSASRPLTIRTACRSGVGIRGGADRPQRTLT